MKTVVDMVNDARTAAERAKAKLMLSRTGTAGVIESPEVEVDRVLDLLARVEEAVQKVAAGAMAKGAAVAAMLTPTGGPSACRSEAPTAKIPRMATVVVGDLADVLDGSLDDLRQMVEDSR